MHFFAFFLQKICICQKKVVTLHRISKVSDFTYSRLGKIHKCLIKIFIYYGN